MATVEWEQVISTVLTTAEQFLARGSTCWYRGERKANWALKSTLHRHFEKKTACLMEPFRDAEQIELLRSEAKSLFREFKTDAWPLLSERERSDWGVLFAMQHFSIPTRLLDWTESFACALFFAQLQRDPKDSASIWLLDPQALNWVSVGQLGVFSIGDDNVGKPHLDVRDWHPAFFPASMPLVPLAAQPIYTNQRMVAQQSRFTLSGDSFAALDDYFADTLVKSGDLRRIVLTPETYEDAENFLSISGVNAFTFYPDLQGIGLKHEQKVAREIKNAIKHHPPASVRCRPA